MSPARRVAFVVATNAVLRVAGGASTVLVGLYLAHLANTGVTVSVALVGTLTAVAFGAELVGAVPMGLLSDAASPRVLMTGGAVLAGLATFLFGATQDVRMFFLSRALEGLAAAVVIPALLAHLSDVTAHSAGRRARIMSWFELSLLAGLALGGVLGSQLWSAIAHRAFFALAAVYGSAAAILFLSTPPGPAHRREAAIAGFRRSLREPALRRLTPIWLCMNAIIGLWLGPTFFYLITRKSTGGQYLAGLLADSPQDLGFVLFGYAAVFGAGLVGWSVILPRLSTVVAMRISLVAMLAVSAGLLVLNHSVGLSSAFRWVLTGVLAMIVMVESGFTPAALSMLAGAVGARAGRGAAMGIYSFLLSLGALVGSTIAALLADHFEVDGLIVATLALALVAIGLLSRVEPAQATTLVEFAS